MRGAVLGVRPDGAVYESLQSSFREALSGPRDDMWASFADEADHHALLVGGQVVGFACVSESEGLLAFFVTDEFEHTASELFTHATRELGVAVAAPSTVDPNFLALCLQGGSSATEAAIMFRHVREPAAVLSGLRGASPDDFESAVAFAERALGAPRAFLGPYYDGLIARRELRLVEGEGGIAAIGECRPDRRCAGFAHLGVIVDPDQRAKGLGSKVMGQLVAESRAKGCEPVCSTEPQNVAARKAIKKAGFAARDRIFRVPLIRRERESA